MIRVLRVLVFQAVIPLTAVAQEPSRYIKLFENRYRSTVVLRASFLERYSEQGRLVRVESGMAYFRKPGKMRWEYAAPENNLFVIDGKTAWFYVPADHTVTRMPAKKSGDWRTPLALLAGEAKVSRICAKVTIDDSAQPTDQGLVVLRCMLKQGAKQNTSSGEDALTGAAEADLVQFQLVRTTGELRKVLVHSRGGVQVEFEFANWEFNPQVDEKSFHFEPPRGVAIVNGDADSRAADTTR